MDGARHRSRYLRKLKKLKNSTNSIGVYIGRSKKKLEVLKCKNSLTGKKLHIDNDFMSQEKQAQMKMKKTAKKFRAEGEEVKWDI